MPKQAKSQKIGILGQSIVELHIRKSSFWIARQLNEDFGIDIELELAPDQVQGKFIKAQIKSHKKLSSKTDFLTEVLPKHFLRYVYECRIPIILILVSTESSETWFVWLQKWLIDSNNVSNIYDESQTKSLSVKVDMRNDFRNGLKRELIQIASWENSTQLYIAVRDLANLSLKLYDDKLSKMLFDYLQELLEHTDKIEYFDSLINKVIEQGTNVWGTPEGNKFSQLLFKFIQEYGDRLNEDHIAKLVIRGKECSRIGINALGNLYDSFPKHAVSLNLPTKFKSFPDPRLHFYCTIRERYINSSKGKWLLEDNDFTVGDLKVDFSSIKTSIFDTWANRGDSLIFDFVYRFQNTRN
ncbi:DUF4365 domain-containing protein [Algoriphagus aestuarii]|nr:DUF4365 domain-containing protein [Algoriphagus aestuarii]